MSPADQRRPAEVSADFRSELASALAPHGFTSRASGATLLRRRGATTHRIDLSSSHHNSPGHVTCWVALSVLDKDVAALEPAWRAGGDLGGEPFMLAKPCNIAITAQARRLRALVVAELAFFDLLDDAARVLTEVRRRYLPGLLEPQQIVPYLRCRLGTGAVAAYATDLLGGRPELWPGFLGARGRTAAPVSRSQPDHGTQLALMLARHASAIELAPPADAVTSTDLAAANLRCFFGRQLRAWNESALAAELRRVPDDRIKALRSAQEWLALPVTARDSVGIVLDALTSKPRAPRRSSPDPELFQYHVLHAPFGKRPARRR